MLPTFLIIGAQKAATTTLWEFLRHHPEIFMPEIKESNFLVEGIGNWDRGLGWYESLYEAAHAASQRGDVAPSYSMFPLHPDPPRRAGELMPGARIIYMIRHPVDRMVSAWAESTQTGLEYRTLEDALNCGGAYFFPSCYGLQLSRWAAIYPKDALLVLRSEDLGRDPGHIIDRILTHLSLSPGWRPPDPGVRMNPAEEKLVPKGRVRLAAATLRAAGFPSAAKQLAKRKPEGLKRRAGLVRPLRPAERTLDPQVRENLLACFRSDFALLRELVGPDLDLYGLA